MARAEPAMIARKSGLEDEYWKQYLDPDEIETIDEHTSTTMIQSQGIPIHIRWYEHEHSAPVVVIAHGMLGYGLAFARFQLPFFRAGFNVVQFDFPGMGQSGGRRGSFTVPELIDCWQDVIEYAARSSGMPVFLAGNAEDGVLSYYAGANHADVAAISVHTLFEYGDPAGVDWVGPAWYVRGVRAFLGVMSRIRPTMGLPGTWVIPWQHVFAGPDDCRFRRLLAADPLGLQRGEATLGYSLMRPLPPPVAFEECRTPVQMIVSTHSRIWTAPPLFNSYYRLDGPKELITLRGSPHWEMSREFHQNYCDHVIKWFDRFRA
jgi:pimeloyl-ACP methyl ester carboxylesterase